MNPKLFCLATAVALLVCSTVCGCSHVATSRAPEPSIGNSAGPTLLPFPDERIARPSANSQFQQGKDAWQLSPGAQVIGNAVQLTAFINQTQWAIYSFPIGTTEVPHVLDLQVSQADTDELWIALADFSLGRWEFRGPFSAAGANEPILFSQPFDPTDVRYISPAGKLYFGVLVDSDHGCLVQNLNLTLSYRYSPPSVQLYVEQSEGIAGRSVTLQAIASDPDGDISTYQWDLDGDGNFEKFTGSLNSTTAVFPSSGSGIEVAVRVTDDRGLTAVDSALITGAVVAGTRLPVVDSAEAAFAVVAGNPACVFHLNGLIYFVRAQDPAGTDWGSPREVDNTGTTSELDLAIIDGKPGIVDSSYLGLRYYRAEDGLGLDWAAPASITTASSVHHPELAEVNGVPTACWYIAGGDWGIPSYIWYAHAFDASGMFWSAALSPANGPDYGPASLGEVNGRPALTFTIGPTAPVPAGPGRAMFLRADDAVGDSWGTAVEVVETGDSPTLAVVMNRPAICCHTSAGTAFIHALDSDGAAWGQSTVLLPGATTLTALAAMGGETGAAFVNDGSLYFCSGTDVGGSLVWTTPLRVDVDKTYSFPSLDLLYTSTGIGLGYVHSGMPSQAIFCHSFD